MTFDEDGKAGYDGATTLDEVKWASDNKTSFLDGSEHGRPAIYIAQQIVPDRLLVLFFIGYISNDSVGSELKAHYPWHGRNKVIREFLELGLGEVWVGDDECF
jgi:hypothetical protein